MSGRRVLSGVGLARPRTIVGLLLRLLRVSRAARALAAAVALGVLALAVALADCPGLDHVRVATFNIESFPRSENQVRGAFEQIAALGASAVAVQEITNPRLFEREARARLGGEWRFVWNRRGPRHRLGLLYDGERLELERVRIHDDTTLGGRHKPTLEVRLEPRGGGRPLTLLVIHLQAGGESNWPTRRAQLEGLGRVIERVGEDDRRLVVLGDWNSTTDEDRAAIAALADGTGLAWASEGLGCTMFWQQPDRCTGSALDHLLTSAFAIRVAALGPCADGCDPGERCPAFHREVSDHCPVVADLF